MGITDPMIPLFWEEAVMCGRRFWKTIFQVFTLSILVILLPGVPAKGLFKLCIVVHTGMLLGMVFPQPLLTARLGSLL